VKETDVPPNRHTSAGRDGLDLPPGFTVVTLREAGNAFAHAQVVAPEKGAGTLVWVQRFDTVEFAVVLEPEQPLGEARRVQYAIINATCDAIATHCPPERPLGVVWPDMILLDGGVLGGAQLAWPMSCSEEAVPDWLVAGVTLRTVVSVKRDLAEMLSQGAAGLSQQFDHVQRRGTSLEAEGFEMLDAAQIINGFCRHLMVYLDQWQEKGFVPVGQTYLSWVPSEAGVQRGIDVTGDLLLRGRADLKGTARRHLVEALATPQWIDPATGEPWL
jgi:biotin-(acetyl-CoA carboxylase) ligase